MRRERRERDATLQRWIRALADAQADLENRIAQHRKWLERQTKDGKPIPQDRKRPPADLRPGPIGNHNFPGHCYAGMIAPLEELWISWLMKEVALKATYNAMLRGRA